MTTDFVMHLLGAEGSISIPNSIKQNGMTALELLDYDIPAEDTINPSRSKVVLRYKQNKALHTQIGYLKNESLVTLETFLENLSNAFPAVALASWSSEEVVLSPARLDAELVDLSMQASLAFVGGLVSFTNTTSAEYGDELVTLPLHAITFNGTVAYAINSRASEHRFSPTAYVALKVTLGDHVMSTVVVNGAVYFAHLYTGSREGRARYVLKASTNGGATINNVHVQLINPKLRGSYTPSTPVVLHFRLHHLMR